VGDWNMFFAVSAGSAATLLGLLFVATQLHLDVFTDRANRWTALAQSTLTILSVAFALSLFMLMPGVPSQVRAEVIALVVAFSLWRTFRSWWPVFRLADAGRAHRLGQSVQLLILPVVVYLYLLFSAILLLRGDTSALFNIGGGFLSAFAVSLRNAWRLVVNVGADAALTASKDSPNPARQDVIARPGKTKE
jgi:hypothetical protein